MNYENDKQGDKTAGTNKPSPQSSPNKPSPHTQTGMGGQNGNKIEIPPKKDATPSEQPVTPPSHK